MKKLLACMVVCVPAQLFAGGSPAPIAIQVQNLTGPVGIAATFSPPASPASAAVNVGCGTAGGPNCIVTPVVAPK